MKSILNTVLALTLLVPTVGVAADFDIAIDASEGIAHNVRNANIVTHIFPTQRNVVSKAVRRAARKVAQVLPSKAKANDQRNHDIAKFVYESEIEAGNISSADVNPQFRQVYAKEIFGEQPGIFTRGYNAVKSAASNVAGSISNAASAFKNYAMIKYAENGRGVFAAKAAGITALGVAATYLAYKAGKYAYKKLVKKSSKKIRKIAAGAKRAVKKA